MFGFFGCGQSSCRCASFSILYPSNNAILQNLQFISGVGRPGAIVTVRIDDSLTPYQVMVDNTGHWVVGNTIPLTPGTHWIYTTLRSCGCCSSRNIQILIDPTVVDSPNVLTPVQDAMVLQPTPVVTGTALPNAAVTLCIQNFGCQTTAADAAGFFSHEFTVPLPNGPQIMTAFQIDPTTGRESATLTRRFYVQSGIALFPPVITYPQDGSTILTRTPTVTGRGYGGFDITYCVDGVGCRTVRADANGQFSLQLDFPLNVGLNQYRAYQTRPGTTERSPESTGTFTVSTV